jgi:NAD-dependent dihydropyrimidine dehydrogenase PreA subunit
MIILNLSMGKKILFCNCGSERINPEKLQTIETSLKSSDIDFVKISDLCGVSVKNSDTLRGIFPGNNEYLILACHSRTIRLLIDKAGIDTKESSFKFVNFFESDTEEIIREAESFKNGDDTPARATIEDISNPAEWISWYPIIDYSRCTSCGQCADFCLFGVYDKSHGKVNVVNPEACKNNCPACARICPQTAIIFPKYKHGGAIGGSGVIDEISEQIRQVEDINAILNGDIYSALEQRKLKRKSIIREEAMNKAIEERLTALSNLNRAEGELGEAKP